MKGQIASVILTQAVLKSFFDVETGKKYSDMYLDI
jgi:hypothetical protein